MRPKKLTMSEIIFSLLCLTILFLTGRGIQITIPLAIVLLFRDITFNSDIEIKKNKKFVNAFILVFILYMGIHGYYDHINIATKIDYSLYKWLLIQLPITMTIFTAYIFGVRIKDFNWKLSFSSLLLVLVVWLSIEIIPIIDHIRFNSLADFINQIIGKIPIKIYYPSLVEEVLFRGLCFSGLLAIGLDEDKSNIIQAVVFGFVHLFNYEQFSINIILLIVPQIYIGFLIGKIYINTKSLTPCIILHALIDSI